MFFCQNMITQSFMIVPFDNFIVIKPAKFREFLIFIKINFALKYTQLTDLIVYDLPHENYRHGLIYLLSNPLHSSQCFIVLYNKELKQISSVQFFFKSANWLEREAWDLYGLGFEGNCNLNRLLTDYGFKNFPLKKTFPLSGFEEIIYSNLFKKLKTNTNQLPQSFRKIKF